LGAVIWDKTLCRLFPNARIMAVLRDYVKMLYGKGAGIKGLKRRPFGQI
jgi:hypothetical protein